MMDELRHALSQGTADLRAYWYYVPLLVVGQAVFFHTILTEPRHLHLSGIVVSIGIVTVFVLLVGDPGLSRCFRKNFFIILKTLIYTTFIAILVYLTEYSLTDISLSSSVSPQTGFPTLQTVLIDSLFVQPVYWTVWVIGLATFTGYMMLAAGRRLRTTIVASPAFFLHNPVRTGIAFLGSLGIIYAGVVLSAIPAVFTDMGTITLYGATFPNSIWLILTGTAAGTVIALRFLSHYFEELLQHTEHEEE
jgi:hypothetical protein